MASIDLTTEHGYVLIVAFATYIVHYMYMAVKVMGARKKYNVKYPVLYADSANCPGIKEEDAKAFNCVQRGMMNSLENLPGFILLLLPAGIQYPITSAVLGLFYLAGRVGYMEGYCTGVPANRTKYAAPMYIGSLGLLITIIRMTVGIFASI